MGAHNRDLPRPRGHRGAARRRHVHLHRPPRRPPRLQRPPPPPRPQVKKIQKLPPTNPVCGPSDNNSNLITGLIS